GVRKEVERCWSGVREVKRDLTRLEERERKTEREVRGVMSSLVDVKGMVNGRLGGSMPSVLGASSMTLNGAVGAGSENGAKESVFEKDEDRNSVRSEAESFRHVWETIKTDIVRDLASLEKKVKRKVDTAVLEELMRHIATKEDVRRVVDKKLNKALFALRGAEKKGKTGEEVFDDVVATLDDVVKRVDGEVEAVRKELDEKVKSIEKAVQTSVASLAGSRRSSGVVGISKESSVVDVEARLKDETRRMIEREVESANAKGMDRVRNTISELREWMENRFSDGGTEMRGLGHEDPGGVWADHQDQHAAEPNGIPQSHYPPSLKHPSSTNISSINLNGTATPSSIAKQLDSMYTRITRDFDEKLFLLCSDLSACKALSAKQVAQPFYRYGQWVWRSGRLKFGSAIAWGLETVNTDPENLNWSGADSHLIRIATAGLYEISFAFFTKYKPSVQLVVNGESVLSAINSPTYVVHTSSGIVKDGEGRMREGSVSGVSLVDFLALPAKSTLSIHYHAGKKQMPGHGFLGLRRL
ncbi:hypothetical protein HK097_008194, partial [Rhizophlyctis rosea]